MPLARGQGFLNPEFWQEHLADYHDQDLVSTLVREAQYGVDIGYHGPSESITSPNWPSAWEHQDHIETFIREGIQTGKVIGPLESLPPGYKSSPLGAFVKPHSEKVRIIHDLSYPPNHSVNDGINREDFSLTYASVDDAVTLLGKYQNPWMCKLDLANAYMSVKVRPDDVPLLGFSWPDYQGKLLRYCMSILPFGLRSSPFLFNRYADAILYIAKKLGMSEDSLHYLDDYILICASREEAIASLNILVAVVEAAGFTVQWAKTEGPFQIGEFLGFVLDVEKKELRISTQRMGDMLEELHTWLTRPTASKKDLQHIVGKLQFASKVVRDGKHFMRRLIDLSKVPRFQYSKVAITFQAREDIKWWVRCLASHNGVAMFPIPFDATTCHIILTDASDLAIAAVYGSHWTIQEYTGRYEWLGHTNIAIRELAAVLLGLSSFAHMMQNSQLLMRVDNQAIVSCISSGSSREPNIMNFIRCLYFYTAIHHIQYQALYIPSLENEAADACSRLQIDRLYRVHPQADREMTPPIDFIIDF